MAEGLQGSCLEFEVMNSKKEIIMSKTQVYFGSLKGILNIAKGEVFNKLVRYLMYWN